MHYQTAVSLPILACCKTFGTPLYVVRVNEFSFHFHQSSSLSSSSSSSSLSGLRHAFIHNEHTHRAVGRNGFTCRLGGLSLPYGGPGVLPADFFGKSHCKWYTFRPIYVECILKIFRVVDPVTRNGS